MGISVCVGNYGYYNEGELHDSWIELPKSDAEISEFLKSHHLYDEMHEETYISDYDGIPFGLPYGGIFSEYTSLSDLNLLASIMDAYPDECKRVEGALSCDGVDMPSSIEGLCNWVLQADEIPFTPWPDEGSYSSSYERLAYAFAGYYGSDLAGAVGRDALEEHFDYGAYGRWLSDTGFVIGEEGFLDDGIADVVRDLYDEGEVLEMAAGLDPEEGGLTSEDAAEAKSELVEHLGLSPDAHGSEALWAAACEIVRGLDTERADALELYFSHSGYTDDGALEVANVALQADDIYYTPWPDEGSYSSPYERLAYAFANEEGGLENMPNEELERHFDYESYGRELAGEFELGESGYLDTAARMPDEEMYDREELEQLCDGPGFVPSPSREQPPAPAVQREPATRGAVR